jgi:hypothetical protein
MERIATDDGLRFDRFLRMCFLSFFPAPGRLASGAATSSALQMFSSRTESSAELGLIASKRRKQLSLQCFIAERIGFRGPFAV